MYNKKQEAKTNSRVSHLVNKTFALAMICEGLALNLNAEYIYERACKVRAYVNKCGYSVADQFGGYVDTFEPLILQTTEDKDALLVACVHHIKILSSKFEQVYRQLDANFDFYQQAEVDEMYRFAKQSQLNKEVFDRVAEILKNEY